MCRTGLARFGLVMLVTAIMGETQVTSENPAPTSNFFSDPDEGPTDSPTPGPVLSIDPDEGSSDSPTPSPNLTSNLDGGLSNSPTPSPNFITDPDEGSTDSPTPSPNFITDPDEGSTDSPTPSPNFITDPDEGSTDTPTPSPNSTIDLDEGSTDGPTPSPNLTSDLDEGSTDTPTPSPNFIIDPDEGSTDSPTPSPNLISNVDEGPTDSSTPSPMVVDLGKSHRHLRGYEGSIYQNGKRVLEAYLTSTCGFRINSMENFLVKVYLHSDLVELPPIQHKNAPGKEVLYCKETKASVLHRQSLEVDTAFDQLIDAFYIYHSQLYFWKGALNQPGLDVDALDGRIVRISLGSCKVGNWAKVERGETAVRQWESVEHSRDCMAFRIGLS